MAVETLEIVKTEARARLQSLREVMLATPYSVCIQKARLITEFMKSPEGQIGPMILRRAGALEYILDNVEVIINDDELIAGAPASRRISAMLHPDLAGLLLWPELHELSTRETNPMQISDEEIAQLETEIFPFWSERSVAAYAGKFSTPQQSMDMLMQIGYYILTQFAGISHITPNYEKVLKKGFGGITEDAEAQIERLEEIENSGAMTPDLLRQLHFHKAVKTTSLAATKFAGRYRSAALEMAEKETDPQRREELLEIAGIFERVPAEPARTFREALQSIWLAHVVVHQENFQHGISFGRLDRMLHPYYIADVEAGRIDYADAVELLGCMLVKSAEILPLFNSVGTKFFSGLSSAQGITLGGTDSGGLDSTNELSHAFLDAFDQVRLRQPNLHARIHSGTPEDFLIKIADTIKKGGGMPGLFGDAGIIPGLSLQGENGADAWDYSIVGCVEPNVQGKTFSACGAAFINLGSALEMALNNGKSLFNDTEAGPATGEASQFGSIDEVVDALHRQIAFLVQNAVAGNNSIELAHMDIYPTPILSALVDGCTESGRDVTLGGALYNCTGMQGVGLADVADSLAALDTLVFENKSITMAEFLEALSDDFQGHERLLLRIRNQAPKYGNEQEGADKFAKRVASIFSGEVLKYRNPRGGSYVPGFWTMTTHNGFGSYLGALPNGRRAGASLAEGITPTAGSDKSGPTAAMRSILSLDNATIGNGCTLNQKFSPSALEGEKGSRDLASLIKTYFDLGGMQVQFNVVDRETLLDAREHPEKHRGLLVRVSGYSAYFSDLTPEMQDDIIARSEQHAANGR
jgi:formate C-acetyltransferase